MGLHHDKITRPLHAAGKMVVRKQLNMNTLISLLLTSIATQLVRFSVGRLSFSQVVQLWRFWYIRGYARYQPHTCFLQQRESVHYRATSRQDARLPCPGLWHGCMHYRRSLLLATIPLRFNLWILLWWQCGPSRFAVFSAHIDIGRCFLKSLDTYKPFSIATWRCHNKVRKYEERA